MQVRDGSENVTGERELYTGVNTFEVVAIAPTVEEMSSVLGFKEPKAPTIPVGADEDGNVRVRIDFWLRQPEAEVTEKRSFFITRAKRVSTNTGTTQHINSVAQTGWWVEGESIPSNYTSWYNTEGVRPAYQGEEEFIQFMQAYLNHKGGKSAETFGLKDWNAIFNGDFTELRGYMKQANEGTPNRVGLLMAVREVDGKYYQSFYRKLVTRSYQDMNKAFSTELGKDGNEFTDDYQNSLVWQKWTVGGTVDTGEKAGTTAASKASVW